MNEMVSELPFMVCFFGEDGCEDGCMVLFTSRIGNNVDGLVSGRDFRALAASRCLLGVRRRCILPWPGFCQHRMSGRCVFDVGWLGFSIVDVPKASDDVVF